MLLRVNRRLGPILAGSLCVLSLVACGSGGGTPPGVIHDDDSNSTGDGDTDDSGDSDAGDRDGDGGAGDGDGDGDGAFDGGLVIGGHVVNPAHLHVIEDFPQPTEAYGFDKNNNGKLTKELIAPNAELGYWYLVNGDYERSGPSLKSYIAASPPVKPEDQIPGRVGANQQLAYLFTAAKDDNGNDVAGVNCTSCHFSHLNGKLIPGLGRANHFVQVYASGETIDLVGIFLASLGTGDTGQFFDTGLGFLGKLFGAASHSHFMDIFADLAARHDPKTLAWVDPPVFDLSSGFDGWVDFPAWWLLKKKNALYYNGTGRGVKAHHLQYMSWFSVNGLEEATKIQNNFIHVYKWIEELEAPKYEDHSKVKIDRTLATKGEAVFEKTCATCHGTYAENDADESYPNLLVDYAEVGTDPNLADHHWLYPAIDWYKKSWYGQGDKSWFEKVKGYVAPPLDGVWATAPYFHNGSVPTLEGVIDPTKRPASWGSVMGEGDFDFAAVGWKNDPTAFQFWSLDQGLGIYDTSRPGYSNKGHTYGAHLSADEKRAVLEYLKSL